jgi:hypothetical protein
MPTLPSFVVHIDLSRPSLPVSARLAPRAPGVSRRSPRVSRGRLSIARDRSIINRSASIDRGARSRSSGRRSSLRSSRRSSTSGVGGSTALNARSLACERSEELPSRLGSERVAGAQGSAGVAAVPSDERYRLRAAFEVGADGCAAAGGNLGDLFGLAAVVLHESVGELDAAADRQHVVADTVDTEVGDWVGAAVAAADQTASDGRNGAELARARAGDGVGHASAVGETSGEALSLVNTEVGFDLLDDGVDESDVGTTAVGPAGVDAVGGDEDGGALSVQSLKAVPGLDAVAIDHIVHGTTAPVEAKDQAVRVVGVVVLRDFQGVLATIDGLNARSESGLAAASARGCSKSSCCEGRNGKDSFGGHGERLKLVQQAVGVV